MKEIISMYKICKEILEFLTLIITIYTFIEVKNNSRKNKRKQKNVPSKKRRNI